MDSIYQFAAKSIRGEDVSMDVYQSKVLLIVNTASKCGFTSQYSGLQELYDKYKDEGLVILGFPCDQFNHQEPGDEEAIQEFCQINHGVTFPLFSKIEVNGTHAHPMYQFLTDAAPGVLGKKIKWNFTKFLINRAGQPVKRYAPVTKPKSIEADIAKLLKTS